VINNLRTRPTTQFLGEDIWLLCPFTQEANEIGNFGEGFG